MDRRLPWVMVVGLLSALPAVGAEPGSSFAEFSFQDPSHGDRGAGFRAVAQLGQRLVLDVGLDAREHLGGGVGLASIGAGARLQSAESTRIVLGASVDAVGGEFGPDDEPEGMSGIIPGAGLNVELAHRYSERVEVLGRLKVTTIEDCPWVLAFGARYYLGKRIALAADVLKDDFGTRIGVGVRLDFSRH